MEEKKSKLSPTAEKVLSLVNDISDMERTLAKKKWELVNLAEGRTKVE